MGRYQVCVGKTFARNGGKPKLYIEVNAVVENKEEQGPDTVQGVTEALPRKPNDFVKLMAFDVTEPTARFIKVVTLANAGATKGGIWEAHSVLSAQDPEEKSIQILHKRKSAGRVVSFSEATSTILNRNLKKEASEILDNGSNEEVLDMDQIKGKLRTLTIDVNELKTAEKMTLNFDTENTLFGSGNNSEVLNIENVDENGNTGVAEERTEAPGPAELHAVISEATPSESLTGPELVKSQAPPAGQDLMSQEDAEGEDILNPSPWVPEPPESPVKIHITVTNDLMITIELENNMDETNGPKPDSVNNNSSGYSARSIDSMRSAVASDVDFHLPYQNVFLDGLQASPQIPFPVFPADRKEQREARKTLLKKLVFHRLLALGTPNVDAHNITDYWHSGYVQHRALSYRVPNFKPTVANKFNGGTEAQPGLSLNQPRTDFLPEFLRNLDILKVTLNSATASVLELEFFLMLPHFKTRAENSLSPHLPGAGINSSFIKDWIEVIQIAAHQLKPFQPMSVHFLLRKEIKLLKKLLDNVEKACGKMKMRMKGMTERVEMLKQKTTRKLRSSPEWSGAIERKEQPQHYSGFSHLQMVGFSAPNIFQNYLYMQTGKFGLFLKRKIEEPWFPFSDLNFLERRSVFLGMTDHMYTSFDAALVTIRHLEELFTPGYPMCLVSRLNSVFELLASDKPFQLLSPDGKTQLYSGVCGVAGALQRFKYVSQELTQMVKDTKTGLHKTEFSNDVAAGQQFQTMMMKEGTKLNLVVPFTTLNLEGFSNLQQRGTVYGPFPMKKRSQVISENNQ